MLKSETRFFNHCWRPLLLVIIVMMAMLVLTSEYFPFWHQMAELKAIKPWFNPYLFVANSVLILFVLFYHRSAFFLPLSLLMCLGLNLLWLGTMSSDTHCHLQRLQNNNLSSLLQTCPNDLGKLPIYVHLGENYKGRTLKVPAGMLDDLGLFNAQIMEWGRIGKIELENYDSNLSSQDVARIMRFNCKIIDLSENEKYVFVTAKWNSSSPIIIKRRDMMTFIGPLELLTSNGTLP